MPNFKFEENMPVASYTMPDNSKITRPSNPNNPEKTAEPFEFREKESFDQNRSLSLSSIDNIKSIPNRFQEKSEINSSPSFSRERKEMRSIDIQDIPKRQRPLSAHQNSDIKPLRNMESPTRPYSAIKSMDKQFERQSKSLTNFKPEPNNLLSYLVENQAKFTLICQTKDQSGNGLLSNEEFSEAAKMLGSQLVTDESLNQLIAVTNCKNANKIRYKSFIDNLQRINAPKTIRSKVSVVSDVTANYDRFAVIPLAHLIWDKKLVITSLSQSGGMRPRVAQSASELLSLMKKSGITINIHQLKAVLREGNLSSASPLDLIKCARNIIAPSSSNVSVFSDIMSERGLSKSVPGPRDEITDKVRGYLKEFSLPEFFKRAGKGNSLNCQNFVNYITSQSGGKVKAYEAEQAFRKINQERDEISENEFCRGFQFFETPKQSTDRALRKMKNWLRTNKMTAEQGFNLLKQISGSGASINKDQ